jgi:uncharacterized membrane protein
MINEYDKWHNDPDNWKWGIFYYNRKDKRIFPPKKYKNMGWTINFGNPYSVLILVGLLILMILLSAGLGFNN